MMVLRFTRLGYGSIITILAMALLGFSNESAKATTSSDPSAFLKMINATDNGLCPALQSTLSFTFAYGDITVNGQPAPIGTIVKAYSPRGTLVGCTEVTTVGHYGSMYIYGEDNSVTPTLPGMRSGETVTFQIFENQATAVPSLSWSNDREPHQIALSATVTAPVAPQVAIAANGTDVHLTWNSAPSNLSFEIHRHSTPFFSPSATTFLATLSSSSTTFTDVGILGNVNLQHYYIVRAVGDTEQLADSIPVGAIDYAINAGGNQYSFIGLPFEMADITNAATLATHIGNVQALLKWNAATQTFRFFVPPTSGDNFPVQAGDAIFLQVSSGGPTFTTIAGTVTTSQIQLTPGAFNFLTVPPQKSALTNATETALDIGGVTALLSWNSSTQLFRFFAPPNSGDRFSVSVGTPLVINLGSGGPLQWQ